MANKIKSLVSDFTTYWKTPMPGRYMPFKEIAGYAGGGIGAYFIITMGTGCLLGVNNTIFTSALGVKPIDLTIMYALAVIFNIPLTGIRANIIDNTRNKAGKYRPYILRMAIPTAIVCNLLVWIPYGKFYDIFPETTTLWGKPVAYILMCAIVFILNLVLQFFYYFFYDSYENLIHLLSPNTQERADVASIKSVVYSLAPSIVGIVSPLIAGKIFHTTLAHIRPYRLLYPILTVGGLLLCIIVYKNTEEKIIQAKSHIVQINFLDALKAVAKNKYFWIISTAGWIGFLEGAFSTILIWLYSYGGACTSGQYSLITTLYGNASLWGMLAAPFCIRKWGKKAVLVTTNCFNIVFILSMLPFVEDISAKGTIWFVMACMWFNALMGSFAHILNPSIQADIRDYQQYVTGERIDGMFSAVSTLGTVIALVTSFVIPAIQTNYGLTEETAKRVVTDEIILKRVLGDGQTVGEVLASQTNPGANAYNALYDPEILGNLLQILIIVSAVGALMNVIPYLWYDFNEKKQKSVVNVLKIRAMFESYSSGIYDNATIVEGVDIINSAREMAQLEAVNTDKKSFSGTKKERKKAVKYNEDIEIAKFVCDELDKFSSPEFIFRLENSKKIVEEGLAGLFAVSLEDAKAELAAAKAMPKGNENEKKIRVAAIEIANSKIAAVKAIRKAYSSAEEFVEPDYADLEALYDAEDTCDANLKKAYADLSVAKKSKDKGLVISLREHIKKLENGKKTIKGKIKAEQDKLGNYARAAKPYINAGRLITQSENYQHFDDFVARYDQAIADLEAERQAKLEADRALAEAKAAKTAELKAKKAKK